MAPRQLKFTFANHDNAAHPIVIDVTGDTLLDAVRVLVLERWPAAVSRPERAADVRLFCMGKTLEAKTIEACGLPSFDFPTPVHVVGKPSRKAIVAEKKAESMVAGDGESCCCIT